MDPQPSAPPVVAVVVTCDPGPWFEQTLGSLAEQDYPNLSVLVVDAASLVDPTPRVASVLPHAYVRRLPERVGFARAANDVLGVVEGASHYLLCHDDVALAPDALRLLVEEAFRSNAGVVCPKMVDWEHPERLLAVGATADRLGGAHRLVERGELDQEQHDAVRDVFVAPGGATLVRADLFGALGGYDPEIDLFGEDINLSWRAQLLGARVLVAPEARVRHLEAITEHQRPGWTGASAAQRGYALSEQHRLRNLLTCAGTGHLLWLVPLAAVFSVVHAIWLLAGGHGRAAAATLTAWPRALRSPRGLYRARRGVQRQRTVPDGDIHRLQLGTSARVRGMLSDRLHAEVAKAASILEGGPHHGGGRDGALPVAEVGASMLDGGSAVEGRWKVPAGFVAVLAVVLIVGTRSLLFSHIPGIGQLPVTTRGPGQWWREFFSGWRADGLGSTAAAPPALALFAAGGSLLIGAVALLQHVVVLGPLVVGPWGAWRAARPFNSAWARVAAASVYAAVPVPYNALAAGRWSGLVAYAAAPWLLAAISRACGDAPHPDRWQAPFGARVGRLLGLGLGLAFVAAFVPAVVFVVPFVAVALAVGASAGGGGWSAWRAAALTVGAAAVAVILLLPWSLDVLGSRTAVFGVTTTGVERLGLGAVLRFHTGPIGGSPLDWGFFAAAVLPLLLGRSWRLAWATRLWAVALACWGLVWMSGRGWLPVPMSQPEIFLSFAAAALALSTALGVVSFALDLPGYQFGWRQLASGLAALAAAVGVLPTLGAATGGRWHLPTADESGQLALPSTRAGDYRVLWVGSPQALPLGSWWLENGYGYATSEGGMPDLSMLWPPRQSGATPRLAADLRLVRDHQTTRLGHLLAAMGVRYIVIPNDNAPAGAGGVAVPVPADLLAGLSLQVDLRREDLDPSLTVYENAAWAPVRSVLTPAAALASRSADLRVLQSTDLAASRPVLTTGTALGASGRVPSGRIYVAATDSSAWRLTVDGRSVPRRQAFGWAMSFDAGAGGSAKLETATPTGRVLALLGELVLVVAAGAGVVWGRRLDRRDGRGAGGIDPAWFQPLAATATRPGRTAPRRPQAESSPDDDEMWADA